MRIATISDIHGNLYALQAVLADIERQGIDQLFCLGDLVGYGPYPNEVIELIRQRHIPTIMGNYDDGVGYEKGRVRLRLCRKGDAQAGRSITGVEQGTRHRREQAVPAGAGELHSLWGT